MLSLKQKGNNKHISYLNRYFVILIVIVSVLVSVSLIWNILKENADLKEYARIQARAAFNKDVLYRSWNAGHGGVYVRSTTSSPPNKYLDIAERDIETPSGKKLTLINPAYMTRQVYEIGEKRFGIYAHITSLNPIRPENKATEWEKKALLSFESGNDEVSSVEYIGDKKYMFLMKPLITEKSCLKCHQKQGYKLGDVRGGIRVSIPLESLTDLSTNKKIVIVIFHSLFWILALWILIFGRKKMIKIEDKRYLAEHELNDHKESLEELVLERTKDIDAKNKELIEINNDLEKYNDLFVGREFRIKELREKIIELEEIISNK